MRAIWQLRSTLLALALAGCASTGPSTGAPEAAAPGHPEVLATTSAPARPLVQLVVDPASDPSFRPRVEKTLTGSGLSVDLFLDGDPPRPADYVVRMKFNVRELPLADIEGIWAMTDFLLLTMYPATCNRYRFSLEARVANAAGQELRTYSQHDIDTAWIWLLMGPKCASPEGLSGNGVGDAAEHLLEALYRRMAQDGVLDPARSTEIAAARAPLVYVTTNRAEDLIREGLLLEESPLRFSFDPADAPAAEYTLALDLAFSGREYSAGRAFLALMTAGLSGVCPTHSAALEGSAFDRQGHLRGHYRTEDHWQPSMSTNCRLDDEYARPETVRELARDLQRQLTIESLSQATDFSRSTGAPLVRITTNAARPAVERVTSERRPFERVTFDAAPSEPAGYLLDLQFSTGGGGTRLDPGQSTAKQMALGALIGLTFASSTAICRSTTYGLTGTLKDASGTLIWSYEIAASAVTKTMGCLVESEPNPDMATRLVDKLYSQLEKDSRLPPDLRRRTDKRR